MSRRALIVLVSFAVAIAGVAGIASPPAPSADLVVAAAANTDDVSRLSVAPVTSAGEQEWVCRECEEEDVNVVENDTIWHHRFPATEDCNDPWSDLCRKCIDSQQGSQHGRCHTDWYELNTRCIGSSFHHNCVASLAALVAEIDAILLAANEESVSVRAVALEGVLADEPHLRLGSDGTLEAYSCDDREVVRRWALESELVQALGIT